MNNYDFADILTGEIPTDIDSAFSRSLFNNFLQLTCLMLISVKYSFPNTLK